MRQRRGTPRRGRTSTSSGGRRSSTRSASGTQVRLERAERLARVGAGGQRADLDLGVAEQQAQHLAAGVPAGSGDRDCRRHVHDYTLVCIHLQVRSDIGVRRRAPAHYGAGMTQLTLTPTSTTSATSRALPCGARRLRPRRPGALVPGLERRRPALAPRRRPGLLGRIIGTARKARRRAAAAARVVRGLFEPSTSSLGWSPRSSPPTRASEAWTWSTDQTVGFIVRRQAHEALIHRLDAELTAGGHPARPRAGRRRRPGGARRDVRRLPAVGRRSAGSPTTSGSTSPTPASRSGCSSDSSPAPTPTAARRTRRAGHRRRSRPRDVSPTSWSPERPARWTPGSGTAATAPDPSPGDRRRRSLPRSCHRRSTDRDRAAGAIDGG